MGFCLVADVFVSSVSAYTGVAGDGDEAVAANYAAIGSSPPSVETILACGGLAEATPTSVFSGGEAAALQATEVGTNYGQLKAMAERLVERKFGNSALILRPGYIVGPYDPTGRWVAWPQRVAQGGTILAYDGACPLQWVDVRDLADFTLKMCSEGRGGQYNIVGTQHDGALCSRSTLKDLLTASKAVTGSDATFVYATDTFLQENAELAGLNFSTLPFWNPDPDGALLMGISNKKAVAAGLTFRPLQDTIAAALELAEPGTTWGLKPEVEGMLLDKMNITAKL
eukprot:SAG31_NODE_5869_length_2282_cov_1.382501_3_plen_284_part_00